MALFLNGSAECHIRKCPGKYFADRSVWVAMVMILAKFTISRKREASGHVHEPEARFETGFVRSVHFAALPNWSLTIPRHPKKFTCDIIARQ